MQKEEGRKTKSHIQTARETSRKSNKISQAIYMEKRVNAERHLKMLERSFGMICKFTRVIFQCCKAEEPIKHRHEISLSQAA